MKLTIGFVAPSSVVPKIEFDLGLERLEGEGVEVRVHPQCRKQYKFFAGDDEARAQAFFDYARDPSIDVLWCARGGYGAGRLIGLLEELTRKHGKPPRKLLLGYSDTTVLHEFVRVRWGWDTLHTPMPGLRSFCRIPKKDWDSLFAFVKRETQPKNIWGAKPLKFIGERPSGVIRAPLVGGNLSVCVAMVGTPLWPKAEGRMFFFEDTDEALYRVDRMVGHLLDSGSLKGARAIVLGEFTRCHDRVGNALIKAPKNARERERMIDAPKASELGPIRKTLDEKKELLAVFGRIEKTLGIPIAYTLPIGHGSGKASLPLGAEYSLSPDGRFELLNWDWTKG